MAIFFASCGDSSAARPSEAVDTTTAEAAMPINMRDQRPTSRLGLVNSTSPEWAEGFMGLPPHARYKPRCRSTHRRAVATCGPFKFDHAASPTLDRDVAETSIVAFSWKTVPEWQPSEADTPSQVASLRLDVRGLDDRAPLVQFAAHERGQFGRRRGVDDGAAIFKFRSDCRFGQHSDGIVVNFLNDVGWSLCRHQESRP